MNIVTLSKEEIKKSAPAVYATEPKKSMTDRYSFVSTDKIITGFNQAGSEGSNVPYIDPKKISNIIKNIPFLSLKHLIRYKLASGLYGKGRLKDFADIQFLIEVNKLKMNYADSFREDLKNKYIEIWIDTME